MTTFFNIILFCFIVETLDSRDEDCDGNSYVYEIDENAEGELIDIPPINVPPENIVPPPPPRSHHHHLTIREMMMIIVIAYIFYSCFLIVFVLSVSAYTYMKYSSQKVVFHLFTANIIGFKTNGSHEPLNVSVSYLFYNPNSKLNLDVRNGTARLYFGLDEQLSSSIHHLSLQTRQQKVGIFLFQAYRQNQNDSLF